MEVAYTLLLLIGLQLYSVNGQTCTPATNAVNTYSCLYSTAFTGTITAVAFATPPQKIYVTDVNGTLSGGIFAGAHTAMSTTLSSRTENAFILNCATPQGYIDGLSSTTLSGLGLHQEFYFRNCRYKEIPADFFNGFDNVTHIEFSGGVITTIHADAFKSFAFDSGFTAGNLTFDNVQIINNTLPDNIFNGLSYLRHLSLINTGLISLKKSMLEGVTTLASIDLTGNRLTSLDSNVFDNLPITTFVAQDNMWTCDCGNVWIFNWVTWNRIDMSASMTCETPAAYKDVRLYTYNVTVCAPGPGIDPLDVIIGTFLFIALALSLAALGMSIVLKAHLSPKKKMEDGSLENLRKWSDDDEPLIDDLAPDSRPTSALSADREDPNTALLMNLQKRPATGMRKETHNKQPKEITTTTSEEEQPPAEANGSVTHGSQSATPVPPVET